MNHTGVIWAYFGSNHGRMIFDEGMALEEEQDPNICILQGVQYDSLGEITF